MSHLVSVHIILVLSSAIPSCLSTMPTVTALYVIHGVVYIVATPLCSQVRRLATPFSNHCLLLEKYLTIENVPSVLNPLMEITESL